MCLTKTKLNNNMFNLYCTLHMKDMSQSATGAQVKTKKNSHRQQETQIILII